MIISFTAYRIASYGAFKIVWKAWSRLDHGNGNGIGACISTDVGV
jgi:hypothetical protein